MDTITEIKGRNPGCTQPCAKAAPSPGTHPGVVLFLFALVLAGLVYVGNLSSRKLADSMHEGAVAVQDSATP